MSHDVDCENGVHHYVETVVRGYPVCVFCNHCKLSAKGVEAGEMLDEDDEPLKPHWKNGVRVYD